MEPNAPKTEPNHWPTSFGVENAQKLRNLLSGVRSLPD